MAAHRPLNRFRQWWAGTEQKSLASPEAWLCELFGASPALSGVSVTPQTAMRATPVRGCVLAISESVGSLPIILYERGDDVSKSRAPDHPAYALVHDDANPWTSARELREQVTRDALLWGNGYAYIVRVDGKPVELHRLDPQFVAVMHDGLTGEPRYKVKQSGSERSYSAQDIIHIRAPALNGIVGDSPVHQAREAIGLALVMEAHAARLFGRGARPAGILKFPAKLGNETASRIKTSWQAAHGGENSGGTAVLEEGGDFTPISFSSVDAQFLELRRFSVEEICRVYRVPPHMIFELGRATWGNSVEMRRLFLDDCLVTWLGKWESEVRLKLIAVEDRKSFFAEFLTDSLLRVDFTARMDGYAKAIAARVLNPNEARAAENRPPYAGGERFENPNTTSGAIAA